MLEVPPDDRTHADRLGQARHARPQAADAAHDEIDLGARRCDAAYSASIIVGVDEAVHLQRDAPVRRRGLRASISSSERVRGACVGATSSLRYSALAAVAGEVVEQLGQVGAEIGVGGQQAEVLVERRGLRVVVAGADVAVAADAVGLLAHDERRSWRASSGRRRRTRRGRPPASSTRAQLDVGLLVEARLELDERDHLLARLGGFDRATARCRPRRRRCGTASA